ncbi:MAG: 50S ribosomal protein L28 [Bacillota bacterium]
MAKCDICGKATVYGNNVSHSVKKTNRTWKANVKKARIIENGTPKTIKVCSRCLRSNKITRAV